MPAKIVHLIGQLSRGGAEKQLFYVARALGERGWPQAVASFDVGGAWAERLIEPGIPVFPIPRHPLKPWRLWQLWRILRRQQPGILLIWSGYTGVYARWLFGIGRPRIVFNLRSNVTLEVKTGRPAQDGPRFWAALSAADCVVSNSACALDALKERGVALRRSEVVGNIAPAPGRARPAEPVAVPRIVAAGALTPLKAYDVLLEALGQLAAQGAAFELHVAGRGPEQARLQSLAAQWHIADRVQFLGEVEDVPALMADAHLMAHPSRSEGLCNAILEAMAEGLPVIASCVGGNPEIVEDGRTGLLVPPGAAGPLAAALQTLLNDPALRGRLGAAGLQRVRQCCDETVVADHYQRILNSL